MSSPEEIEEIEEVEEIEEIPIIFLPEDDSVPSEAGPTAPPPAQRREPTPAPAPPAAEPAGAAIAPAPFRHFSRAVSRGLRYVASRFAPLIAVAAAIAIAVAVSQRGDFASLYPSPGGLARPHAGLHGSPGTGDCRVCHSATGLTDGCLGCHEEVATQLAAGTGLHGFMNASGREGRPCAVCHREHRGSDAALVDAASWQAIGPAPFGHEHVEFKLQGRHELLQCAACHAEKLTEPFRLAGFPKHPRRQTYLGLRQDCAFCHDDFHSDGRTTRCDACHGQDAFRPAIHFSHPKRFPLAGGHARVPCGSCHPSTEDHGTHRSPDHFAIVRGTACSDCHRSPHRSEFGAGCRVCHGDSPESWDLARSAMTSAIHDLTGFHLSAAHEKVECVKCHDPALAYERRFQHPSSPGYNRREDDCEGCHQDVHAGQFVRQEGRCIACHERDTFKPHHFTREEHADTFPLQGEHAQVSCDRCHTEDPAERIRVFVGTPRDCRGCHKGPHGGQFAMEGRGCEECHGSSQFVPTLFTHKRHETVFPLRNAHAAVPCLSCHRPAGKTSIAQFVGTPTRCKSCHESPHGGQFQLELTTGDCTTCHRADASSFTMDPFDHDKATGFPLQGAHATASCERCHVDVTARAERETAGADGSPLVFRRFRGTSTECSTCHRDEHRGQFRIDGHTSCGECHASTATWSETLFDHDVQSRFPLEGAHAALSCGSCHLPVRLPDGEETIRYKPIGVACNECHQISSR